MTNTMTQQRSALRTAARQEVVGVLREILSDPDAGFLLQGSAVRRLKQSLRSKETGGVKDLREVLKQYEK